MTVTVVLQKQTKAHKIPSKIKLQKWVAKALQNHRKATELTIRVVDEAESAELNAQYRHKNKPTNVLSFPFETIPGFEENYLGDLIICASVVEQEAREQDKLLEAHWAHMVIHGVLHLLGFDHIKVKDAKVMEALETKLLMSLGYTDPYEEH